MDLKSRVPESVKAIARPLVWRLSDMAARSRGTLSPPRRLAVQVPGDFVSVGREFLAYFRNLGHLRPDQRVLDVRCGPGRMAIPLTGYISAQGSYEGVDTWLEAVEWCSQNITARFGNFHFSLLEDSGPAGHGAFPYEDATFDFVIVCAISRLAESTFGSYVSEAGRLLRPGGTYLGTCFLRAATSTGATAGAAVAGPGLVENEGRLIFSEAQIREMLSSNGLALDAVYRGSWDGHPTPLSYQDIVVATKRDG